MARTDEQLYDLLVKSKCYQETVDAKDKAKVYKARRGEKSLSPRSAIGIVAWELGKRAYIQEQVPDPPEVPIPPSVRFYAPQAYNKGSSGQNARFNIRINCVPSGSEFVDGEGVRYDDSGRQTGNIRSEQLIPELKPSDEMDGKEVWESYVKDGRMLPPYPAKSYER